MNRTIISTLLAAAAIAGATAPAAAARAITLDQARAATAREANTPGTFTEANVPVGFSEVPTRWTATGGFCHRQPFNRRAINCWAHIEIHDWPECSIEDLYRVRRIGRRIVARQLGLWTSYATRCPGNTTIGLAPAS